jgi:hypothetical protein
VYKIKKLKEAARAKLLCRANSSGGSGGGDGSSRGHLFFLRFFTTVSNTNMATVRTSEVEGSLTPFSVGYWNFVS